MLHLFSFTLPYMLISLFYYYYYYYFIVQLLKQVKNEDSPTLIFLMNLDNELQNY